MIVDAHDDAVGLDLEADVVVVGAGPAGLTLAHEVVGARSVLVIEAGGAVPEPEQDALLEGECLGFDYPLTETRARGFGGSGRLWAGFCARLDPADMPSRDWVHQSGWPISFDEVAAYYSRASQTLNIEEPLFDPGELCKRAGIEIPSTDEPVVTTAWRHGQPIAQFGPDWEAQFADSPEVVTLTHATVTSVEVDQAGGRVTGLEVRTLSGRRGRVTGSAYVLACGGIETARLLLNSRARSPHGVANSSGMVGRCFMEHPHRQFAWLHPAESDLLMPWSRRSIAVGSAAFRLCFGLTADAQRDQRILNARAHIYMEPDMTPQEPLRVGLLMEQEPNPDCRVELSDRVDRLGVNTVRLDWRLTELDNQTYERTAATLLRYLRKSGMGEVHPKLDRTGDGRGSLLYSNHHLGTTRMSGSADEGVVDANCRAHDVNNLYVIGGSVFPTASWANPTLTVLALTHRLAAHLTRRASRAPEPVTALSTSAEGDQRPLGGELSRRRMVHR